MEILEESQTKWKCGFIQNRMPLGNGTWCGRSRATKSLLARGIHCVSGRRVLSMLTKCREECKTKRNGSRNSHSSNTTSIPTPQASVCECDQRICWHCFTLVLLRRGLNGPPLYFLPARRSLRHCHLRAKITTTKSACEYHFEWKNH